MMEKIGEHEHVGGAETTSFLTIIRECSPANTNMHFGVSWCVLVQFCEAGVFSESLFKRKLMIKPQPPPYGSDSVGREFLLFCVTFLKLEPPCSQKAPSPQPPPYAD